MKIKTGSPARWGRNIQFSDMILFTVDANFIDEMKIGRQFPGLMKFYNKICFINTDLFQMWCSKAWIGKLQISFNNAMS